MIFQSARGGLSTVLVTPRRVPAPSRSVAAALMLGMLVLSGCGSKEQNQSAPAVKDPLAQQPGPAVKPLSPIFAAARDCLTQCRGMVTTNGPLPLADKFKDLVSRDSLEQFQDGRNRGGFLLS